MALLSVAGWAGLEHASASDDAAGAAAAQPASSQTRSIGRRPAPHRQSGLRGQAEAALRDGRLDEADRLFRQALDETPGDADALAALWRIAEQRDLPKESEAYASTRAALGPLFAELESSRFIVLSNADYNWARQRAEHLERTYHQFSRFAKLIDMPVRPLDHKLVCVLFRDRDGYRQFASEHDMVEEGWIAGYYAPQSDRVVFYHASANPSVHQAEQDLARMENELRSLRDTFDVSSSDRGALARLHDHEQRYRAHIASERERVDAFVRELNVATTTHEAMHQISFHTRLQSPYVQYPVWISEGLATSFETVEPSAAFGPDHEYAGRRQPFHKALSEGRLVPLRDFVGWTSVPHMSSDGIHELYCQSYALVTWMARFQRSELRTYLQLMLEQQGRELTAEEHVALFEQAFGDVDRLEKSWLRHEWQGLERQTALVDGDDS